MNILFLNWKDLKNPDVGGAEIILYELAKRLVADGHRVTWFCRSFVGAREHDIYDGIEIIRRGNKITVYWEAYRYYQSLMNKPDKVIDCINTICWQTPLYIPKSNRVMLVNQLAKEVFFYELPFPLGYIAYALERIEYLTYRDTKVFCYAPSTKKDLETFGIPKKNISVFPLGVDHNRYKSGKKSKDPLFLFVARLTSMKRPDLCVEAMSIVVKKYSNAKLAIVGYGPMESKLEGMIQKFSLEKNVYLVNKNTLYFDKDPKDVKVKLMQQAWALLLPSVKEGWGMVVTEAAACGTPSIVTSVTGLIDSVVHNKTGIVVDYDISAEGFANQILSLINDRALSTTLGKNAMRRSKSFNWNKSYHFFSSLLFGYETH